MTEENTATTETADKAPSPLVKASPLAMGMLFQDGAWALQLYLLSVLPALLRFTDFTILATFDIKIQALQRIIEIFVIFVVGKRWLGKFTNPNSSPLNSKGSLYTLLLSGLAIWASFFVPAFFMLSNSSSELVMAFGPALIIPGAFILYTYYFYFFPVLVGARDPGSIHQGAVQFLRDDKLLPLKAMAAPFALMVLLDNSLAIFAPENEIPAITLVRLLFSEVFFFVGTYLALAICFVLLSAKEWHDLGLEPYREARFTTISLQAPRFFAKLLLPKSAVKMLFLGILIGLANMAVLSTKKPSAEISVASIQVAKDSLVLKLHLSDEKSFRSFSPIWLSVAGPEKEPVTDPMQPVDISIYDGQFKNMAELLQERKNTRELELTLTFSTTRPGEDMKEIEDLHLWYRSAKLLQLNMQDSELIREKEKKQPIVSQDNSDL